MIRACASISLEVGISRYIEWIRSQGDVREYFSDAEAGLRRWGIVKLARTAVAG